MLIRKTTGTVTVPAAPTWGNITPPAELTWTLPFAIQRHSQTGAIRVDPTFDLEAYANVTETGTSWVKMASEGGSDSASGADEAHAFATIHKALSYTSRSVVMVKAGTYSGYPSDGWNGGHPNASFKVKAYGGAVIITMDVTSALTWNLVGNHYEASYASNLASVYDFASPDSDGDATILVKAADAATVDSTPGSWFSTGGVIYVRTSDNRQPDTNIHCSVGSSNGYMTYGVTQYLEGLTFWGGPSPFNANLAGNGLKLYCKNCNFKYSSSVAGTDIFVVTGGGGEVGLQGCVAARGNGDCFKMLFSGAYVSNLFMIDCIGRYGGLPGNTNANGYSRHGPGSTVGINCEFHHTYGPSVKDVNDATLTWLLGCYGHDSLVQAENFGTDNATTMWLDTCRSVMAGTIDVSVGNVAARLFYHNMTPAVPAYSGPGTIAAY
jgi:hypothetical protein